MLFAESLVVLLCAYAGIGVLFAIVFLTRGVEQIDPACKASGIGFRLIILPGVTALWPVLLLRWLGRKRTT